MNMAYDSLNYARKLKRLGVPEQQAIAHAQTLTELIKDDLATKNDLNTLETSMTGEFKKVREEFKIEIQRVETELKHEFKTEIQKLDAKIDSKFLLSILSNGTIVTIATGTLFAALKYLP